jgi:cell division initiation protein
MIDLTPLDIRKKKGDFRRELRGYASTAVDDFLDLVAERMEELVRENLALKERTAQMSEAVTSYREREQAMNEALVSAQQLREEYRAQASREADLALRDARAEAERILAEAKRHALAAAESTRRVHAQRSRFVRAFRAFVERQLSEIELEEERLRDLLRADGEGAPSRARKLGEPPARAATPPNGEEPQARETEEG